MLGFVVILAVSPTVPCCLRQILCYTATQRHLGVMIWLHKAIFLSHVWLTVLTSARKSAFAPAVRKLLVSKISSVFKTVWISPSCLSLQACFRQLKLYRNTSRHAFILKYLNCDVVIFINSTKVRIGESLFLGDYSALASTRFSDGILCAGQAQPQLEDSGFVLSHR